MAKFIGDLEETCSALLEKSCSVILEESCSAILEKSCSVILEKSFDDFGENGSVILEKSVRRYHWRFGGTWSA